MSAEADPAAIWNAAVTDFLHEHREYTNPVLRDALDQAVRGLQSARPFGERLEPDLLIEAHGKIVGAIEVAREHQLRRAKEGKSR